jgi:hypothetical protein
MNKCTSEILWENIGSWTLKQTDYLMSQISSIVIQSSYFAHKPNKHLCAASQIQKKLEILLVIHAVLMVLQTYHSILN